MDEFNRALKALNKYQLEAVEQINGPVMVVAGPGTGKTQLLALRVANILKKDSTVLPSSILCLTFTDAAADNLRERLIKFIGQDAYRVGVYTFHSFGAHIMSAYPEYFFTWRETKTADSLTSHRILEEVLSALPGDNELARHGIEGDFYAIRQLKNLISDSKGAGIPPDELELVINDNAQACEELLPIIRQYWPDRMSIGSIDQLSQLVEQLAKQKPAKEVVAGITPIKNMIITSLAESAQQSLSLEARAKTKPFTAWKDQWLAKTGDGWIFKSQAHSSRLLEAVGIYRSYQAQLSAKNLADFSDQINWTLSALKSNRDLRLNLREQYLYVMIDEFQDTNRAQLQMASYLSHDDGEHGESNFLVVGDDDQAIYRFQGADIANIGEFELAYPGHKTIKLSANYRSNSDILQASSLINTQIVHSLAKIKNLDKKLSANQPKTGQGVVLSEFEYDSQHNAWTAQTIKDLVNNDQGDIAVLARERAQLDDLVPYLRHLGVAIDYERRENILDQEHIVSLLAMARLIDLLAKKQFEQANALLPQIISEPMWKIEAKTIWQVASQAYKTKSLWLDVIYMQKDKKLVEIADFFVELASQSTKLPMEQMLDKLIGASISQADDELDYEASNPNNSPTFVSPFKNYYFSDELRTDNPARYLSFLSHLSTLRKHLRNYQTSLGRTLVISDLLEFTDAYHRAELSMVDSSPHHETPGAIKLMTIHGAKGLEFDSVFVLGLQHSIWTKSGGTNRFSYPANLLDIKPSDNQDDDGLRLLFVAMTRAKQSLYLNYYKKDESAKTYQAYAPVLALGLIANNPQIDALPQALAEQYEQRWLKVHGSLGKADMGSMLEEKLSRYQLSATHLNNFVDVTSGGPLYFLTQNLLNFPSALTPSSAYGSVVHGVLAKAHTEVIAGKTPKVKELLANFEKQILAQALSQQDKARFIKQGKANLERFFKLKLASFDKSQKVEVDFKDQGVVIGRARLSGKLDLIEQDSSTKSVWVSDYKTGSAITGWQQPPSAKEYMRIKAHRYRQQLLFYKLLIDGSNEFGLKGYRAESAKLIFVEPDSTQKIRELELTFESDEIDRSKKLVKAVWKKIMNLEFDDVSSYPATAEGIRQFEDDLIKTI